MFLARHQAIDPCQFHHPSPVSKKRLTGIKREREIEVRQVKRSRRDRSEIERDDTLLITQLTDPTQGGISFILKKKEELDQITEHVLLVLSHLLLCHPTTV